MKQQTVIGERGGLDIASLKRDFEHHLKFTFAQDQFTTQPIDQYQALALTIRDRLVERWIKTQQTHHYQQVKRVYYLSLEFLMGRVLTNNIINLKIEDEVRQAVLEMGLDYDEIKDLERDMGLGNGGLGRLAACFLDSLATLQIPAFGYGIRYDYGIFKQVIRKGHQVEFPDDWLKWGNPWEIPRLRLGYLVPFGGRVVGGNKKNRARWVETEPVVGIPYDVPIVGYGGHTVNTLRLWSAHAAENFDLGEFNKGDYGGAVQEKIKAENLTKVLYPNDVHYHGKELRLRQQFLFVSCSLQDILRRFKKGSRNWSSFPDKVAIQLNDTHPSLVVPELMRLLVDEEGLPWSQAWQLTVASTAYTNHTLMPEALEKWSLELMERLLPRHLQIIYHINQAMIDRILVEYPGDMDRVSRMSIIEEGPQKQVRMAHLAMFGSHSVNGVAQIHTQLLKQRVAPDFAAFLPDRFNSKTNGITQRRWLLGANPPLASLITETIGPDWITHLDSLENLVPLADDPGFQDRFRQVKHKAKCRLAAFIRKRWDWVIDPEALFDVHIKRLHEYKRQLMNAIHILMLYNRLKDDPGLDVQPRVFLFGAKAAAGYDMAKLIIKLIHDIAQKINGDSAVREKLQVLFLPNYGVTLAEEMIPATDVSEQISTAGTEASGTGNMKFMLNGALTVGTLDGANIEMAEAVGPENMFIFGLDADQAREFPKTYHPKKQMQRHPELARALDMIFEGELNPGEPHLYHPIRRSLLEDGDRYLVLADLPDYSRAHKRVDKLYRDSSEWTRRGILNTAHSGRFSSDRTIGEYAREIWRVGPCPID